MKQSTFISLFVILLFTSCYSAKELNENTGLYEKSKYNKLFLTYGKDYSVKTKIYNNNSLIAVRTTHYVFNCRNTVKKAEEIIYYDENQKKTKHIKYCYKGKFGKTIVKAETIFDNKETTVSTIGIIDYSVETLFEIKTNMLYE